MSHEPDGNRFDEAVYDDVLYDVGIIGTVIRVTAQVFEYIKVRARAFPYISVRARTEE